MDGNRYKYLAYDKAARIISHYDKKITSGEEARKLVGWGGGLHV